MNLPGTYHPSSPAAKRPTNPDTHRVSKAPAASGRKRRVNAPRPLELIALLNTGPALRLRIAGHTYRQIGAALGVSHTAARRYIVRALRALNQREQRGRVS